MSNRRHMKHRAMFDDFREGHGYPNGLVLGDWPALPISDGEKLKPGSLLRVYDDPTASRYTRKLAAWCLIGPTDYRGYSYALQWVRGDRRGIMVRAGCRFLTLEEAYKHWGRDARYSGGRRAAESRQALAAVMWMYSVAQQSGYLQLPPHPFVIRQAKR